MSGLAGSFDDWPRYRAQERAWVRRILCTLTEAERKEYERRCADAPRHHSSGRLYDRERAKIAEAVKLEFRARTPGGGTLDRRGAADLYDLVILGCTVLVIVAIIVTLRAN